eukprot:1646905-Alexandrium_andersonii.AAC.1
MNDDIPDAFARLREFARTLGREPPTLALVERMPPVIRHRHDFPLYDYRRVTRHGRPALQAIGRRAAPATPPLTGEARRLEAALRGGARPAGSS